MGKHYSLSNAANNEANHQEIDMFIIQQPPIIISAAKEGRDVVVKEQLLQGCDPDTLFGANLWTPLMWAAHRGHSEVVKTLIEAGAAVDHQSLTGWSPLILSARQGNIVIVEALLVQSASIDITTGEGWTPIMFASTNNHVEVGKILLEHGASVSISDKNGYTPLGMASQEGNTEFLQMLCTNCDDIDLNNMCKNPRANQVVKASWIPLMLTARSNHVEAATVLLNLKADPNGHNSLNVTALHIAAFEGFVQMATLLLDRGAAVNSIDKGGSTPLNLAQKEHHPEVCKVLQSYGAE